MGLDKSACANQSQKLLDDEPSGSYSGREVRLEEASFHRWLSSQLLQRRLNQAARRRTLRVRYLEQWLSEG